MVSRRSFLGGAALGSSALMLACDLEKLGSESAEDADVPAEWWHENGYFVHDTVDTSRIDGHVVRARIDRRWQRLQLVEFPEAYWVWNISERMERLRRIAQHGFSTRDLAGPHNACVATYGGPGRDSKVSLNTAYKGLGFLPRRERLAETLRALQAETRRLATREQGDFRNSMTEKLHFLARLYADRSVFDSRCKVSLELFTEPEYFTHTFLNMMVNPVASASFLAYPTFELRAVPQLLHPENPALSEYERQVTLYTNAIHDFIHGGNGDRIVCIYHLIGVYDDTPNASGHGKRLT